VRVSVFYFLYFATVGVVLPYLWPYLKGLEFSGRQIGLLAAIGPTVMVVVPPLWGWLADRTRRVTAVLKVAVVGSTLAFAPLLGVEAVLAVGVVLAVQAIFHAPITALADTVAVAEARRIGTEFARLRLWGSVGFVVATFAFGFHLDRGGAARDVLWVTLSLFVAASLFALTLRPVAATPAIPSLADARRLALPHLLRRAPGRPRDRPTVRGPRAGWRGDRRGRRDVALPPTA
jgi:MFS transporter, PPP family, 3-phenylpropionic acid transporter